MSNEELFLVENNGKTVIIDGLTYRIKTNVFKAIYPYHHTAVSIYLEPVSKKTANYIDVKKQLKDDWVLSYTSGSIELQVDVLTQIGYYNQTKAA